MGDAGNSTQNAFVANIERVADHNSDTRSLFLRVLQNRRFIFQPGQFLSLSLPVGGKVVTRAYSLASNPNDELLEICLNLVPNGLGSAYLFDRRPGECLHFTGPWGTFVLDPLSSLRSMEYVFLAEGTGIVPLRPMIRRLLFELGEMPVRLLHGVRQESDLLYRQELEDWAQKMPFFCFDPILSAPTLQWSGEQGTWLEHTERRYILADQNRSRQFFICGVGRAVTQLRDMLRHAGYERRAVHYEKW